MNVLEAIESRRSIRRFTQTPVSAEILEKIIDVSRLYASGRNLQPIRFGVVAKKENTDKLFPLLKWAGYLPDFTITEAQRPTAYVVLCAEEPAGCMFDIGAASTSIMLAAKEFGLDSCCLMSFQAQPLRQILNLSENLKPAMVIALGYPGQQSRAVPFTEDCKYFETPDGVLNVPKYATSQLLIYSDTESNGKGP